MPTSSAHDRAGSTAGVELGDAGRSRSLFEQFPDRGTCRARASSADEAAGRRRRPERAARARRAPDVRLLREARTALALELAPAAMSSRRRRACGLAASPRPRTDARGPSSRDQPGDQLTEQRVVRQRRTATVSAPGALGRPPGERLEALHRAGDRPVVVPAEHGPQHGRQQAQQPAVGEHAPVEADVRAGRRRRQRPRAAAPQVAGDVALDDVRRLEARDPRPVWRWYGRRPLKCWRDTLPSFGGPSASTSM